MPRPADELTVKQRRFVAEFLATANASAAAIAAGYSEKTARQVGYKLIRNHPAVQKAIAEAEKDRMAELEVSAWRLDETLARIAFARSGPDLAALGATARDQINAVKLLYERLGRRTVPGSGATIYLPDNGRGGGLDWTALLTGSTRLDDGEEDGA